MFPSRTAAKFGGTWSNYPYFKSGDLNCGEDTSKSILCSLVIIIYFSRLAYHCFLFSIGLRACKNVILGWPNILGIDIDASDAN